MPKVLPPQIEHEIKEGFYELRQKFKQEGSTSIYISHNVLHEKHPIFSKLELDTVKKLLRDSTIIQLSEGQALYTQQTQD